MVALSLVMNWRSERLCRRPGFEFLRALSLAMNAAGVGLLCASASHGILHAELLDSLRADRRSRSIIRAKVAASAGSGDSPVRRGSGSLPMCAIGNSMRLNIAANISTVAAVRGFGKSRYCTSLANLAAIAQRTLGGRCWRFFRRPIFFSSVDSDQPLLREIQEPHGLRPQPHLEDLPHCMSVCCSTSSQ